MEVKDAADMARGVMDERPEGVVERPRTRARAGFSIAWVVERPRCGGRERVRMVGTPVGERGGDFGWVGDAGRGVSSRNGPSSAVAGEAGRDPGIGERDAAGPRTDGEERRTVSRICAPSEDVSQVSNPES
jgi:hypothetical protein